MFRYYIYLFITIQNKVSCLAYNVRRFDFNNDSIDLYPIDYSDVIHIHMDSNMRFEVIPYTYLLDISREDNS